MPFDREKMKVGDKKWLLIDGHFICFSPDDQTMQSNLVQRGAKVLMGFQSALVSFVQFISSQLCYLESEACLLSLCGWTRKLETVSGKTLLKKIKKGA